MDIHKPKPWHGWREFLKELGTIILGIVIALSLEAAVEALRERGQAAEARRNIRQELAENLGKMQLRAEALPCEIRRLDEAQDLLDRAGRGERLPQPVWIGGPDVWQLSTSLADVAAQSGRTALLSTEEQAGYARLYSNMRVFGEVSAREQQAWATLRVLEREPKLDPALRAAAVLALQDARFDRFRIQLAIAQAQRQAAASGVKPAAGAFRGLAHRQACIPLHTSLAEGQRQSVAGFRDTIPGPSE